MRKIWKALGMAAAVSVLCSCASFGGGPAHYELTEKDSGRTLHLDKGDTFTIQLASNPTTGFQWKIDASAYDKEVMSVRDDTFVPPDTDTPVCGAPGKHRFSFQAEKSGRTGLRLIYARPWEKDRKPVQEFNLVVIVGDEAGSKK